MTATSFLVAVALCATAWVRALAAVARRYPWLAIPCLLFPPLIAAVAWHNKVELRYELKMLGLALICLLPTLYVNVLLR